MTPIFRMLALAVVLPCSGVFAQEKKGAESFPDQTESFARTYFQNVRKATLTEDSLSLDMVAVGSRSLISTPVDDTHLPVVANIKGLKVVKLHRTYITGEGFGHLKRLENLEVLSVEGSFVTDAGLKELKNLPKLKSLNIKGTARHAGWAQIPGRLQGARNSDD